MDEDKPKFCPKITLETTGNLSPVAGHTSVVYRGCLIVYAGYLYTGNQLEYRDPEDLYVYPYALSGDFDVWFKIKCTGQTPKPNCGSYSLICGDSLFVFGGSTTVSQNIIRRQVSSSSTLYKLDLKTGVWEFVAIPEEEKVPTPRDKMTGFYVNNKLYFFGGYGTPLSRLENPEIYLFDSDDYKESAERGVWNNQLLEFDTKLNKWALVPKLGDVPVQRAACASCYIPELHSAFVFGGRYHLRRLNDLYCLDMFSLTWTKLEPDGEIPQGRSWCSFIPLPDRRKIVMQGGYSNDAKPLDDVWHLDLSELYDLEKRRNGTARVHWICVRPSTPWIVNNDEDVVIEQNERSHRYWHTASAINSPTGNTEIMLVYGGFSDDPSHGGRCLNSLATQRLQPSSLFTIAMSSLQRDHLLPLPPEFSIRNLKRKVILLEELRRFKKQKTFFPHINESHHCSHCPSLHELSLGEIFDILDSDVI